MDRGRGVMGMHSHLDKSGRFQTRSCDWAISWRKTCSENTSGVAVIMSNLHDKWLCDKCCGRGLSIVRSTMRPLVTCTRIVRIGTVPL